MTVNEAMLQVAKETALEYGFIEVDVGSTIDAAKDWFWGNQAIGIMAQLRGEKHEIVGCKYILPLWEEEKENTGTLAPSVKIDMHWGNPRLSVRLADKTFACVTYEDCTFREAQAFGEHGLELAASLKIKIDELSK